MRKLLMMLPSAWAPIGMSVIALTLVVIHLVAFGTAREADEGTTAHLWQLLMAGQLPVVGYFAVKWLPRAPRQAVIMLTLQVVAALGACFPVYWLKL